MVFRLCTAVLRNAFVFFLSLCFPFLWQYYKDNWRLQGIWRAYFDCWNQERSQSGMWMSVMSRCWILTRALWPAISWSSSVCTLVLLRTSKSSVSKSESSNSSGVCKGTVQERAKEGQQRNLWFKSGWLQFDNIIAVSIYCHSPHPQCTGEWNTNSTCVSVRYNCNTVLITPSEMSSFIVIGLVQPLRMNKTQPASTNRISRQGSVK